MDYYIGDSQDVRMAPCRMGQKEAPRMVQQRAVGLYATWRVPVGYEHGVDRGGERPGDESDENEEEEGDARGVQGSRHGAHGQNKATWWEDCEHGETGNHIHMEGNRRIAVDGLQDDLASPIDRMQVADEARRDMEMRHVVMRHVVQRPGYRDYMKVPTKYYVRTLWEGHAPRAANIGGPEAHAHTPPRIHQRNHYFQERPAVVVNGVVAYDESNSLVHA